MASERQLRSFAAALLVLAMLVGGLMVFADRRAPEGAWVVEAVDGRPYQAARHSLVRFHRGTVIATAGCNRLNADFRLSGNSLTWAKDHSQTIRACLPPQVMVQEALVFDRLIRAERLERLPSDRLLLAAADGHAIRLRRIKTGSGNRMD